MKILKTLFILSFFSQFLCADINKDIHVAFSTYHHSSSHENIVRQVVLRAMEDVEKEHNIKVTTSFFSNEKEDTKEFKKFKNINMLVTYSLTYLKNKDFFKTNSKNILTLAEGNKFTQYYLIVNKNSNIKTIKDLKNKRFVTYEGNANYHVWLEYLTLSKLGKSYESLIKDKRSITQASTLILDVYFKKSDFSIVPKDIYDDMILLNPAIKKEIKIIEKSEPVFILSMAFIHKKTPKKLADKINKIFTEDYFLTKFKYLPHIIEKFNIKEVQHKDLEKAEKFYDEYLELKRKYIKTIN